MDAGQFWSIIEQIKDSEEPEDDIIPLLQKLSSEELVSFQTHFDTFVENAYKWDLWAAAYVINGGCSDDCFLDFRYGLISKGKEVYEAALENADNLADYDLEEELFNEVFGYVAMEVYEERTEEEMPRKPSAEPEIPMGKEWDFEDDEENKKYLPRLCQKYEI